MLAKRSGEGGARTLRIHQHIAREIGTAILSGELKPGDYLPGEIEHSALLGVSRTPYREATRTLIAKGLLESRPKAGTRVLGSEYWNILDADVLAWMFSGRPDPAFIRDLFELRAVLEPVSARLAAARRSDGVVDEMRAALEDMDKHGLASPQGQSADRSFHRLILKASGNRALVSLSNSVGAAVEWTTLYKQQRSAHPRDPMPEHEAVLEAIAAQDPPSAHAAMRRLVESAYRDMDMIDDGR